MSRIYLIVTVLFYYTRLSLKAKTTVVNVTDTCRLRNVYAHAGLVLLY